MMWSTRPTLGGCPMSRTEPSLSNLALAIALLAIPCLGDSQARIVRLSQVQGDVQVDRNTGQGFEKAFLNLPITQDVKIRTGDSGLAELEFEDGSTLRLTPSTVIEVPQLSLRDSGAKVSAIHLQEGTAYVNFKGAKDDEFDLALVREKIALTHSAHIRVQVGDTDVTVAALNGEVEVEGPSGKVEISKNHKAVFDLLNDDRYKLARDFAEAPYDSWDKQQDQYRDRYSASASSYSPYAYGTSDLNYYGNFSNVPGYGTMWQPYFTGSGWDPFMNGAWAFDSGFGYGWVSAYPWGWTPYHYGSWMYIPGNGWMWQPGGAWMGGNAFPVYANAPLGFVPPVAPALPGQRIVTVNRGPQTINVGGLSNQVQIPNNSAGLGVPRGSISNLSLLSQAAEERGSVAARIHTALPGGIDWGHGGYAPFSRQAASGYRGGTTTSTTTHSSSSHTSSGGRR